MVKIYLTEIGNSKIGVIKLVRSITDAGLKEAKEFVDKVECSNEPMLVSDNIGIERARSISSEFEEIGAKIIINAVSDTKIIELLKQKNKKLSVSDINAYLKYKDIDGVKDCCEVLYHKGDIDYAGSGRYFILSEETKEPKSEPSDSESRPDYLSEIKVLLDLFKKDILTKEQFVTQIEEKLN